MGALKKLFGERQEQKEKKELLEKKGMEEAVLNKALSRVRFFPGSREEYESHVGYQVKVINTGSRNIGIIFGNTTRDEYTSGLKCYEDIDCRKSLVEQGIEALVNCNYTLGGNNMVSYHRFYGLPVSKK